jgi:CMP-N,N'-diacetyllegionaminic acid synthase
MIPARLGSQRVKKKNLRLLNGKPLITYSIEAAISSKVFDEIYINSEAEIFGEIAEQYNVKFYKRSENLASDKTINDEFAYDFIQNVPGDILVQLLPTSPLITPEEIKGFVSEMIAKDYDTLVSVANNQIACLYEGKPINFNLLKPHESSQNVIPVQSYATVLMAWTYSSFKKHMKKHGCAYYGSDGKTGYYVLKGLSTIDIDNEEDLELAEVALVSRSKSHKLEEEYYIPKKNRKEREEINVPDIMKKDSVVCRDFKHENLPLVQIEEIINSKDNSRSWCHRIINTENNSATLISQLPGEGNRLHYHPNWNEWWYIIKGKWKWEIEGKTYTVKRGNVVFIEKNKLHKITAIGDEPAVRLAVSRDLVPHVYPEDE